MVRNLIKGNVIFLFLSIIIFIILVINNCYIINLSYNFFKLKFYKSDINLINVNYSLIKIPDSNPKKIFNHSELFSKKSKLFVGKPVIGLITNNLIILDIDTRQKFDFLNNLPRNTVISKTPRGYHYYFYNDTGKSINSYIHLKYNNVTYPIDLFSKDRFIILPPSKIGEFQYKWINSIFKYKIQNISNYLWILDLFSQTKPFLYNKNIMFNLNNNISIKHGRYSVVIWDQFVRKQFYKITEYRNFEHYFYKKNICHILKYDSNFIIIMLTHPKDYRNYNILVNFFKNLYTKLNITQIIDLSTVGSSTNSIGTVIQLNNCIIEWEYPPIFLTNDYLFKTKYLTNKEVIITKLFRYNGIKDNYLYGEDCFISILVSNNLRIPNICLAGVSDNNSYHQYINYGGHKAANSIIDKIKIFFK